MKTFTKVNELREALGAVRNGKIGFVPTMGALHEGHISLVNRARKECDTVVVSVFVNPTQFNDKNDLKNYPRTPEADAAMLAEAGVDFVLFPTVEEIYPEPDTRVFDFGLIDKVMEGATRPGHFNGVAQVVSRLFAIVEPDKAYFGEKDFQQIAVIRAMVGQLGLKVEIVDCPIVRDTDGLARSSRNTLLDKEHRAAAPHIYEVLSAATRKVGKMSPSELSEWVAGEVERNPLLKVIYFQAVDASTMQQVQTWEESERVQGCIAVQAG
ncbi:MAG: pantoate--beta-alanine ligase, partial [Alistipes sp.]